MIAVVNYGLGNVASILGALERLGYPAVLTADPQTLAAATKLILPGVGGFGEGMANLEARGLVAVLDRLVMGEGKPILGICLGAQLMARESEEFGHHPGLGWFDAPVTRLRPAGDLRVPHVGWNELMPTVPSALLGGIPAGALFYFVHSFAIPADSADVVGVCDYGGPFAAALQRDNIHAVQFHPEKSQQHGLTLLDGFLKAK